MEKDDRMPYIKKEERPELDKFLDPLIELLEKVPPEEKDGKVCYVIFKLMKRIYRGRFFNLSRALGVLNSVIQEFYRRIVAPHEDEKIRENGDVE